MTEKLKASRDANLALYSQYNNTLRSWFVAFGIAVPAIFITSKDAQAFLLKVPDLKWVIAAFLAGVGSQIFVSFINKFIAWSAYHRDDCLLLRETSCHSLFNKIASLENEIWLDFACDLITIICFVWAIYGLLAIGTSVA